MNMLDSSFLCLDIGTSGVRGIAHRIKNAHLDKSVYYSVDSTDIVMALKTVVDELEQQLGEHFNDAYITGNFGAAFFTMTVKSTIWQSEHKFTASDIQNQISQIKHPEDFYPMHIIPMRYDSPKLRNMSTPIGYTDKQLLSTFSALYFEHARFDEVMSMLRQAHIQATSCFAPHFLESKIFKSRDETALFIDMGATNTTLSLWTKRGPVWYTTISIGGNDLTAEISDRMGISFAEAMRIKHSVSDMTTQEMARFIPADSQYGFSVADINEIVIPFYTNLIEQIKNESAPFLEKYTPTKIVISGGATNINGLIELVTQEIGLPVENRGIDAAVRALSGYIWACQKPHRIAYVTRMQRIKKRTNKILKIFKRRHKKVQQCFVPIMPSTLCFDMNASETYTMFKSAGISAIHVDIMDGFYVDRIAGGLDELHEIRSHWNGHLHVHLMTEAPNAWASGAISNGADTIILSTNTSGLRDAIQTIKKAGKRVGIAINPETSVLILKKVLRELDEVMIMAVTPGAAGQEFDQRVLQKITILNETRKRHNLKYTISVDGGINDQTAQACWNAGADLLVSGSYLANAPDFPLAVQNLLKK